MTYIRDMLSADGLQLSRKSIEAILDAPAPRTSLSLYSFVQYLYHI